jgi:hypothetical protein
LENVARETLAAGAMSPTLMDSVLVDQLERCPVDIDAGLKLLTFP